MVNTILGILGWALLAGLLLWAWKRPSVQLKDVEPLTDLRWGPVTEKVNHLWADMSEFAVTNLGPYTVYYGINEAAVGSVSVRRYCLATGKWQRARSLQAGARTYDKFKNHPTTLKTARKAALYYATLIHRTEGEGLR